MAPIASIVRRWPITGWRCGARWICRWLLVVLCTANWCHAQTRSARFVQELPEAGRGEFVKCDLQYRFFDPELSVAQYVAKAVDGGCQVVFAAPPTPTESPDALKRFLQEVDVVGKLFPKVVVIPALTWVIRTPGYSARAAIIPPPGPDLAERFLALPQHLMRPDSETSTAESVALTLYNLRSAETPQELWPVVLFDQFQDGATLHAWAVEPFPPDELWSKKAARAQAAIGQSGLLDRWDQSDLRSGGAWDQLLSGGWNAWAAAEDSDFARSAPLRLKPGEFTATWLKLPELTPECAVEAIRHGAFFQVRGGAVRDVALTVSAAGLPRDVQAGETIDLPRGTPIRVQLSFTMPEQDWKGEPNLLDGVELIETTPSESRIARRETPAGGLVVLDFETEVPEGGTLFRALGYREIKGSADHSFLTNPIRIIADGRWVRPTAPRVSRPWIEDQSGFFVALLLVVLAIAAVGGWLVATGKLSLLFGDSLEPIERLWMRSRLRRLLVGRRRHADDDDLGTCLAAHENRWLAIAFVASTALLGAVAGAASHVAEHLIPNLPAGQLGGGLLGAILGAAWGWGCRWNAGLGVWIFLLLRISVAGSAAAIPDPVLTCVLGISLLAAILAEPFRTGMLRWPAEFPFAVLLGLIGTIVVTTAIAAWFPGVGGDAALICGALLGQAWCLANFRLFDTPLRLLSIGLVMALWLGGALAQELPAGEVRSWPSVVHLLAEAMSVGLLWTAARPQRLDAVGIGLSFAAWAIFVGMFGTGASELQLAWLAVAACAALALVVAEPAVPWKLAGLVAAAALAALSLFPPHAPGCWLLGSSLFLACGVTSRSPLRLCLFLLPSVLASGYGVLIGLQTNLADGSPPPGIIDLIDAELTALKQIAAPSSDALGTAGRFLSLISLASLSAIYGATRPRTRPDVFDGFGRTAWTALLVFAACFVLQLAIPFSAVILTASLIGLWAARIPADDLAVPSLVNENNERSWQRHRVQLGLAAAVIAGLLAYGSLVPFHWRDVSWMEAVQDFARQAELQRAWQRLSSDRVVNLLLTVPLGCCVYGSLVLGRRELAGRLGAIAEAWQLCVAVSLLVELAQHWSVGRVASIDDVVAQAIGAGAGIVLWMAVGERWMTRWAEALSVQSNEGRWQGLLWMYLLGVLVFAVLPAGLPVTSPKQLYDRFREGRIALLPFADCLTAADVARDAVVGVLLFFPVGMWGALAFRKPGTPLRSLGSATANGLAFAALITVVRGLCSVKSTDSSWLLTALFGSALGAAGFHYAVETAANRYASWKTGLGWWLTSLVFAAAAAANFLQPWVFDATPEHIASGWKHFLNTPFARFHAGDDWQLIDEVVRKLAWFAALGILLGQAVFRSTEFTLGRIVLGAIAVVLAAAAAFGIEIAQLHQTTHQPEITDVLIYCVGALLGLWIRFAWLEVGDISFSTTETAPPAPPSSWVAVLQTAVAVGLALGLLAGLAVLFLRR